METSELALILDLCGNDKTSDPYTGTVEWPLTDVGARRYVRCPYALPAEYVYASRDCLVNVTNGGGPLWAEPNITACPLPPLSRTMNQLYEDIVRNF